jgi:hypothetical protein
VRNTSRSSPRVYRCTQWWQGRDGGELLSIGAAAVTLCSVVRKTTACGQLGWLVLALASSSGASQRGGAEDVVNWRKV